MASEPKARTSILLTLLWLALAALAGIALTLAGIYLYLDPQIPKAESYRQVKLETPLRIYTADGALMGEFGERRVIPVAIEEVPELFVKALLDTEDKRFYEHSGVDVQGLLRVIKVAATTGEFSEGASTLTMQTARNMFLTRDQRLKRQLIEMFLAVRMEQVLTDAATPEIITLPIHGPLPT